MHLPLLARRTAEHSGTTRAQARDIKSCDTLSRHGRERYNMVADRTLPDEAQISSERRVETSE